MLRQLLGCAAIWWLPDWQQAWAAVWEILEVQAQRCVFVPVGADPAIEETARVRGASIIESDLDPRSASPVWPADRSRIGGRDIFIVDHRFGLPTPLPRPRVGSTVIEDATAAVGGSVGGQPVGSLGQVSLVRLGVPPFGRSRGALIATHDERWARAAAAIFGPFNATAEVAARLHEEASAVAEWVEGCRAAAQVYESAWRGLAVPPASLGPVADAVATYSNYAIAVADPEVLARDLAEAGVESSRRLNDRLRRLVAQSGEEGLPGARALYQQVLTLPNHPGLGLGELLHVADVVRRHLTERPRG